MTDVGIGAAGVAASLVLIVIAVAISWRERLGLERTMVWAATRAIVQMLVIGAGLGLVFADDAPIVLSSVSYTHLDVYKRQMKAWASSALSAPSTTAIG